MDFLQNNYSGNVHLRKAYKGKDNSMRLDSYTWDLQKAPKCFPVLKKIIPYLAIKKERAEFLVKYIEENPFKRGSVKLSEEVLQRREAAYIKMKMFNEKRSVKQKAFIKQSQEVTSDKKFWAYVAGLLDTDGSFSIKKEQRKADMVNVCYSALILLSMTSIDGLNKIRENCPFGSLYTVKASTCRTGFSYRWGIYSKKELEVFLKKVIPFLRLKQDKAKIMLEFLEGFDSTSYCRKGVSEEQMNFREDCYQRMLKCDNMGSINLF